MAVRVESPHREARSVNRRQVHATREKHILSWLSQLEKQSRVGRGKSADQKRGVVTGCLGWGGAGVETVAAVRPQEGFLRNSQDGVLSYVGRRKSEPRGMKPWRCGANAGETGNLSR